MASCLSISCKSCLRFGVLHVSFQQSRPALFESASFVVPVTFCFRTIKSDASQEIQSSVTAAKDKIRNKVSNQWNGLYHHYEEFVGLAEVQQAQNEVKQAEKRFLNARAEERSIMREVLSVRDKLRHVRERLSHVDYSNSLYPQLANEQHELVTSEAKLQNDLEAVEDRERDTFLELSAAMRDSYEKERARVERTKNWSLIGTVIGTMIGMFGSMYINRVRTKDLKQVILNQEQNDDLKESIESVIPHTQAQYSDIKEEIRNLQVCLINKLMEPSLDKEAGSAMANVNLNNDRASLESVAKILQNFQSQLSVLMEKSKEDQAKLTSQNDTLHEEIRTLKSTKQVDSKVVEEIFEMSRKLQELNRVINDTDKTGFKSTSPITTDARKEPSKFGIVKDMALWGTVLGALYYIINV